ncbi:MAG: M1 family aminopeptidase [Gemmatimonadota bacterium]
MTATLFSIARFELRYYLTRISSWVYFALFFAVAFLIMCAIGGAFPSVNMAVGGSGGNVYVNSPRSLLAQVMTVSVFGFIVTAALLGNSVFRDFEHRMHPLFFTTPISRFDYLGGRFLGALAANAVVFLGIPLGMLVASIMPFLDAERLGPIRLAAYFHPYAIGVLPNLLLTGALFFALAALTRQMLANYVGGVVLLVGYLIAGNAQDLEDQLFAAYVDPFGLAAFGFATRYWTAVEQNTMLLPLEGVVFWNRLIWSAVGLAILGIAFWRFRFAHAAAGWRRKRTASKSEPDLETPAPQALVLPKVTLDYGRRAHLQQYLATVRNAFRGIVLNRYFVAIVGAGLVFLVLAADQVGKLFGTTTYPVTYSVLELLGGMFALFVLIIITFYGGELVWRERDARVDQIVDSTPTRTWVPYAAKLTALIGIVMMLQAVLLVAGIVTQAVKGYFDFEIGLYLQTLFGYALLDYALLCVLIMLFHVLVNHKYMGHAIAILYFVAALFAGQLGFEHNLYIFGSDSGLVYSDMNRYGPYATPFFWFKGYWAAWALLLAVASNLFWVRGRETGPRWRLHLAKLRFSRPLLAATALGAALVVALGGFMFYNTNILNEYATSAERERSRAEYERLYERFADVAQPRVRAVSLQVDLVPEERDVFVRGAYSLENASGVAIDSLHLRIPSDVAVRELNFGRAAEAVLEDDERGYHIYRLSEPLAAGDSLRFEFDLAYVTEGFENEISNLRVVENGTFLESGMMPHFGYSVEAELQDDEIRRKHDLAPREPQPPPDDVDARMENPLATDADWIDFEATISTAPDQIALAPGYLEREWEDGGRRYFHYRMDSPMLAFYSILSARYGVHRDTWRPPSGGAGEEVAIEIFHHPEHDYNVARMAEAVKKSLDYYTSEFGPYQHRQVRILEFPRYQTFAQSFPNTIPYSEAIGFIAHVEDPAVDIDYPFYVTAHEVAHQWWGHQTVGGAVQGATFIIETLSQYSALMVMEEAYGADQLKRFLKYELDAYLMGRAFERRRELPLLRVENQSYIHYNKGSLVMYALRDYIGEDRVNAALRNFLEATRFQEPPYTSSFELYEHLREATPDSLHYVLRDMFEEITLFENRAVAATATALGDGRYRVRLEVEAAKMRADSIGNEAPIPMDDLVDIGVFGPAEAGSGEGPLLYLDKHRVQDGAQTFDVTVEGEPARAGIDPLNKLIDRNSGDNLTTVRAAGGE